MLLILDPFALRGNPPEPAEDTLVRVINFVVTHLEPVWGISITGFFFSSAALAFLSILQFRPLHKYPDVRYPYELLSNYNR